MDVLSRRSIISSSSAMNTMVPSFTILRQRAEGIRENADDRYMSLKKMAKVSAGSVFRPQLRKQNHVANTRTIGKKHD